MIQLARAIFLRDWQEYRSYRFAFVLEAMGALAELTILAFVSKLVKTSEAGMQHGYFVFVIVGRIAVGYMQVAVKLLAESLRTSQLTGTIERPLLSSLAPAALPYLSALWPLCHNSVKNLALLVALWLCGVELHPEAAPAVLLVGFLTFLALSPIGMMVASCVVVWKRGAPFAHFFALLLSVAGGVYFPITLLPSSAVVFARWSPLYQATYAMRALLLDDASLLDILPALTGLAVAAAIGMPVGLLVFRWSVINVQSRGGVAGY